MADEVFRQDGYVFEFEAFVKSVDGDKVVLDTTAFYPGGGGQVCDTGSIREFRVTEAYYKGDEIVHVVPGNNLKVNEKVWCSVDWDRRYGLMQGHTGEHLLFCALHRQCPDLQVVKIYISPESKYVIVNHDLTWEQIRAAEEFANQAIRDNLTVTKSIMDRDDPDLEKVRIKLDRIGEDEQISVVAIGDIDLSACSGVHVMETSELELLVVDKKVSAGKDGVAVHFKVGDQAKDAAVKLSALALEAVDLSGCGQDDLPKAIVNTRRELETARKALKECASTMLSCAVPEQVGGVDVYTPVVYGADRDAINAYCDRIRSEGAVGAVLNVGENISVVLVSGCPKVDCKAVMSSVLPRFGGRGGGKPDFAQGGVSGHGPSEVMDGLKSAVTDALS